MGALQSSDTWTKLAAVGTLTASVIALSVAVVPPLWRRYWRHPQLDVRIGSVEPWARVARLVGPGAWQVWFRVEVLNTGRAEARNVRAVVHAWYERADSSAQWEKRELDPSALHWVSMPYQWQDLGGGQGIIQRETAPVVNLPPGLSDFADLIVYTFSANSHMLVLDDQRPRGFRVQPTHATGEFILSVTLVADNAEALTKHIHYALTREDLFGDVRFEDAPPADFVFIGLLTLQEQLKESRGNAEGGQASE